MSQQALTLHQQRATIVWSAEVDFQLRCGSIIAVIADDFSAPSARIKTYPSSNTIWQSPCACVTLASMCSRSAPPCSPDNCPKNYWLIFRCLCGGHCTRGNRTPLTMTTFACFCSWTRKKNATFPTHDLPNIHVLPAPSCWQASKSAKPSHLWMPMSNKLSPIESSPFYFYR